MGFSFKSRYLGNVRGGGLPGASPGERQLHAGNRMNEAQRLLYEEDLIIITAIAGEGESLDHCAGKFLGHPASKADKARFPIT